MAFHLRHASTPPIMDAGGRPIPGSIASLEPIELGGRNQWLLIRGRDALNPVLLFLAAGPCGSQLGMVRMDNGELEERFVVVNWDQRGAAKSFAAARPWSSLRVDDFVRDTIELAEKLCRSFNQKRILLVGQSWGSILGLKVAKLRPDLFSAYVGVSQQLNTVENDRLGFQLTVQAARDVGDLDVANRLEDQGQPPYFGEGMLTRYLKLLREELRYGRPPLYDRPGKGLVRALLQADEYTLLDRIHSLRGMMKGWERLYPQLEGLDLEREAAELELPLYLFHGRYDFVAPPQLAERYFQSVAAPDKHLVWFEASAHSPPSEEPKKFARELFIVEEELARGGWTPAPQPAPDRIHRHG